MAFNVLCANLESSLGEVLMRVKKWLWPRGSVEMEPILGPSVSRSFF